MTGSGSQITAHGSLNKSDNDSDSSTGYKTDDDENSPLRSQTMASYDRARRSSFIEEDEDPLQVDTPLTEGKDDPVTWRSLPHKRQLAILVAARLSEPLVQSSLRACH